MAERRMFAKSVTNSAKFLMMPVSSRLLYYDLGMAADDDGIVEAFTVLRMTGAAEDDLRVLSTKGFIRVLTEDLISYITDWNRNNYIQSDRYHESRYRDLLVQIQTENNTDTDCIHDVYNLDTEVRLGKGRIGKDRLGEGRIGEADTSVGTIPPTQKPGEIPPSLEEVQEYCREIRSTVDAHKFFDHYNGRDWKVGTQKMTDWKATLRNWDREDREKGKHTRPENMTGNTNEPDPLDGVF